MKKQSHPRPKPLVVGDSITEGTYPPPPPKGLTDVEKEAIGLIGSTILGAMARPTGMGFVDGLKVEAAASSAQLLVRRAAIEGRAFCLLIEEKKGEGLKTVLGLGDSMYVEKLQIIAKLARQAAFCIRSAAHVIQQDLDEDDLDGENEGARDLARELETALLEAGIAPIELPDYLQEDEERDLRNKKERAS